VQTSYNSITDDLVYSGIALSGGGARSTFGSCGAFSAGLMALSTRFSPHASELSLEQIEEVEKARTRFYQFRDWFVAEFGGVSCYETLHKLFGGYYDQSNEESRKALKRVQEEKGFNCQVVTAKTVVKVAAMLGI